LLLYLSAVIRPCPVKKLLPLLLQLLFSTDERRTLLINKNGAP